MAKGRTPNIVNLESRATYLVDQISKKEDLIVRYKKELVSVRENISRMDSPEYQKQLEDLATRKRAELERLLAQLDKRKSDTETETVSVSTEDVQEVDVSDDIDNEVF